MTENVLDFLKSKEVKDTLSEYAIKHLYLFWSYSRWEQNSSSDLDLVIEYDRNIYKITLFDLVKIEDFFKEKFWVEKVDLVTKKSINSRLKPYIEKDLLKVY